jgi:hypothetical protein
VGKVYGPGHRSVRGTAPAFDHLDVYLHGDPIGVVRVHAAIQDLVHPLDHDPFEEPGRPLGLPLRALDDQLVVHREDQLGVEVFRQPLVEEGYGQLESICPRALDGVVDLLRDSPDPFPASG